MGVGHQTAKGSEATKCYFGEINGQTTCFLNGITYDPAVVRTDTSNKTDPKISKSIERIEIINSNIACIPTEIFLVFKNLKTLVISDANKNLNSLKPSNFIGANSLEDLQMNENNIPHLVASNFIKARGLKNIDLSRNRITDVMPHAFTGLSRLERLNLNDNQIETLKLGSLMGLFNLKELRLSNNNIKKIEYEVLRYNKKLLLITFNGNRCINVNFVPYKFPDNEQDIYGICEGKVFTKKPTSTMIRIQEVPLPPVTTNNNYNEIRQAPEAYVTPPGRVIQRTNPVNPTRLPSHRSVNQQSIPAVYTRTEDDRAKQIDYFQKNTNLIESTLTKAQASIKRFEDLNLDKSFYYLELDNFHKIEEPPVINLK